MFNVYYHLIIFISFFIINLLLMYNDSGYEYADTHKNENGKLKYCFYEKVLFILYYTISTHTTVGFGDVFPSNSLTIFLSSLHQLMVFILVSGIVNLD